MHVLVIDDDPLVLHAIKTVLEADRHSVVTAQGGVAGIEAFASSNVAFVKPFDVVMTDLGMPHVDGSRVARTIKKRSPNIPVVLFTGSGGAPSDGSEADFDLIISKPVRLRDLRQALARVAVKA